jgi:hypothetical protein
LSISGESRIGCQISTTSNVLFGSSISLRSFFQV